MAAPAESIDELSERYIRAFTTLECAIDELVRRYQSLPMPIWMHRPAGSASEWLEGALRDIWYKDGQAGNESASYVGLVGAAPTHVEQIHVVNEAKHVFQATGKMLKAQAPADFVALKGKIGGERQKLQGVLNKAGIARLHLKQAWRRLPLAAEPVKRVHFSWYSSGRTIKRMTVAEAYEALCRLDPDAPHIQVQIKQLASLPSSEMLAQVKPQAALMRANITHVDPLPSLKINLAMNVSLPLFVPLVEGSRLPDHNEPSQEPPAERIWPKRRDARLYDEPFLPSIHVHRYRIPAQA